MWVSMRPYSSVVANCNLEAFLTRAGDLAQRKQLATSHEKEPRSFSDKHTSRQSPHPAALARLLAVSAPGGFFERGERPPP